MKTNTALAAALCAAALLIAVPGTSFAEKENAPVFSSGTTLYGADISGKTAEEVAGNIKQLREAIRIQIVEEDTVSASGTPADFGYSLDTAGLTAALNDALSSQKEGFLSFLGIGSGEKELSSREDWKGRETWSCDEEVLWQKIDSRNLKVKRTPSYDAELVYNERKGRFEIQEEVYGNQFDREDMRSWAKEELDAFFTDTEDGRAYCRIEVPETLYRQPSITADSAELQRRMEKLNAYADTEITYTFGEETEVLSFSEFRNWMIYKNGIVQWDDAAITAYVAQLADTYDTRGKEKDFVTTWGDVAHFTASQVEYGYRIMQDLEAEQLKEDLKSGQSIRRDPIYDLTDKWDDPCCYSRNGLDDLNGTYIEVSVSDQYVWFYKDGELIVECDCVTGNHERGWDTTLGVYAISSKASPAVLRGEGYESPVNYWMPFNGGQGLHDATWRGNFGGKIYRSNGSHGCVNLPLWAAEKIYENVKRGMAVVVY